MDQVLYDLMDWAGIEEIVYSEAANPERLLGAHEVEEGLLIQVFMPHAVAVSAKVGNESYPMELQDEAGYYAVLLHGKKMSKYLLEITYDNGTTKELQDPYAFPSQFTDAELKKFDAGIYYDVYRKMAVPISRMLCISFCVIGSSSRFSVQAILQTVFSSFYCHLSLPCTLRAMPSRANRQAGSCASDIFSCSRRNVS